MRITLLLAGIYNILWGSSVILFPTFHFTMIGMDVPNYIEFWQCIGMVVGVYGIGYIVASFDPIKHWPITLVGLLGKILGPIGFIDAIRRETLPVEFGWNIITNDVIWWLPFSYILLCAWQENKNSRNDA